jgi:hypothetical protein
MTGVVASIAVVLVIASIWTDPSTGCSGKLLGTAVVLFAVALALRLSSACR